MFSFDIIAKEGKARAGRLTTPHGIIKTPSFVPVGTQANISSLTPKELHDIKVQVIIANTYHLHLRPGEDTIARRGGLHAFMDWDGPFMTDSGGFQIFSHGAAKEHGVGKIASIFPGKSHQGRHLISKVGRPLVKVDEDGVTFSSYLNGSRHRFTPEQVIDIQAKLGADMMLMLDECTSPFHDYEYTKAAMERTHHWATRSLKEFHRISNNKQALFGIVQGGAFQDLRKKSASFIAEQDVDGCAIGGSLGRSKKDMHNILEWTTPILPDDRPRHLLGIGEIEDVFEIIRRGIDLFDCVTPTRMARTGTLFTRSRDRFRLHILNERFKKDKRPIEEGCACHTCRHHSRAYLRHLFMAKELLGVQLAAIHNLFFLESLMQQIRASIIEKRFEAFKDEWNTTNTVF